MNGNNLKKLHAQRKFWRGNKINPLCWVFYCVNNNKEIPQTMHCIFCHNNPILNVNPKMQTRKGLIIYTNHATNGIVALRKHANLDHSNIFKKFEEEINCL